MPFVNQQALGAAAAACTGTGTGTGSTEYPSTLSQIGGGGNCCNKCCDNRNSYPSTCHERSCNVSAALAATELKHAGSKHEKEIIVEQQNSRNDEGSTSKEALNVETNQTPPRNPAANGSTSRSKFQHNNNAREQIVIETASESDVPRNCVQSFSKIFGKYRQNKKKAYSLACSNKTLVTFNTQFPPADEACNAKVILNRGEFASNHNSCCRTDYDTLGLVNDENSPGVGPHKVEFRNVDWDARERDRIEMVKAVANEEGTKKPRRRTRRRSPRFVAYLPEDYTGSDSIVKCPINTPKWAKDGNCSGNRSRKYYNNYRRHLSSGPRIEYSHHNYFHHSRRFRSKSQLANRKVLYSSFSTSDGMTNAVKLCKQKTPVQPVHLQSRGVQSDDSGNPQFTNKPPAGVLHRLSLPNGQGNASELKTKSPTNFAERDLNRKSSPGDCGGGGRDPRDKTLQTTFVITTSTYHCQNNKSTPVKPSRTPQK